MNPATVQDASGHAVAGTFDFVENGSNGSSTDVTDTVLDAGSYDLSVTFNPTDTTDYSSVTTTASIDITQAKIAIVADSPTITYGDSPTLTNTLYTDLGPDPNNSGQDDYQELDSTALASVAYTSALGSAPAATTDAILSAGDHTINPTDISTLSPTPARSEFLNNFDVVYGPGTLTVTPATLDVTADPQTKVYGAADPTLTYVATGFQFSDNEALGADGCLDPRCGRAGGRRPLRHQPGDVGSQQRLHDQLHRQQPDHHPGHADRHGQQHDHGPRRAGPDLLSLLHRPRER